MLAHPSNAAFVSIDRDGVQYLNIGHIRPRSGSKDVLATLGRGNSDIFVAGCAISKIQCSFEVNPDTGVIMLYDRSHGQTTQVFGQNSIPFEYGRPRKVAVQEDLNEYIGMGGRGQNLVRFQLIWPSQGSVTVLETLKRRVEVAPAYMDHPHLARTVDEAETVLPSQRATRIHTPGPRQPNIRWTKLDKLGEGTFSIVYSAVDVDSGTLMAVKSLRTEIRAKNEQEWEQMVWYALKREVETLAKIDHVSATCLFNIMRSQSAKLSSFMTSVAVKSSVYKLSTMNLEN